MTTYLPSVLPIDTSDARASRANELGERLYELARALPANCMTRIAIEENRPWREILSAAGCERRTVCASCEREGFDRTSRFRDIVIVASLAHRAYRLGGIATTAWRGDDAIRAALRAAAIALDGIDVFDRALAALVIGVRWPHLAAVLDETIAAIELVRNSAFCERELRAIRAVLFVNRLAVEHSTTGELAPSVSARERHGPRASHGAHLEAA